MNNRLSSMRNYMSDNGMDGLLITSPFNRRYLSGFTGSSGYLLITLDKAQLITDFRYAEQAQEQAPDFEIVRQQASLLDEVGKQIKDLKLTNIGFEKAFVPYSLFEGLQQCADQVKWIGFQGAVEEIRMIKTPEELETIKEACRIADGAFQHILGIIKPGVREIDIALELEFYMRRQGATSSSFDIIVASGARSALPHGVASEKRIEDGDMVTLDFGAYHKGYVSDITRTVAVGKPSPKLQEIYDVVLRAQLAGVSKIKAGLTGMEADALTRDIIASAGFGEFFGHSTGHGIGLEVHEGPGLSSKSGIVLQPGMVVTVEPGVYISQLGGVRIEDDVVITKDGCEILTHSTKELIIL